MASKKVLVEIINEDRISSLPDGVLCHILSFIPTKYSVRTSVLSTRWKHLFTFVPNLDFEYDSIKPNSTVSSKFMHFVNSVFMSYNVSSMNKFHVRFFNQGRHPKSFPMFSWICGAIRRHVKAIDINCFVTKPTVLPLDLFSCKTLTSLKLAGRFNVVLPRSVCLPCLRTCYFLCVKFDDESAKRLFRSCPVLERLVLIDCIVWEGVEVLDISSPTLKELSINGSEDDFKLMFNIPNLLKFSYTGPATNKFLGLDSLKSLVDAYVFYESYLQTQDSVVLELVRSFYNVQRLSLNCYMMEAFTHLDHSLPNFDNLTTLTLNLDPITSLASRLLPDLLHNSPRLVYLKIENECQSENYGAGEYRYLSSEHVPACVSQHLKEVEITFTGLDYERELIKYLMKYANNLKKMIIRSKLSWSEQYEISSEACEVVIDVDEDKIYD